MSDYKHVDLSQLDISLAALELLPEHVAREHTVMPINLEGNTFTIAVADSPSQDTLYTLEFCLNRKLQFVLADKQQLLEMIDKYYDPKGTESVESIHYEFELDKKK